MTEDDRPNETEAIDRGAIGVVRRSASITRRTFLKGVGVGTAAVGVIAARGAAVLAQSPSPAAVDPLAPDALATVAEDWVEPEVWRPFGSDPLLQTVVENVDGFRFSYGGKVPGTTIRMRGDETLYLRIENELGEDAGMSTIGPNPDAHEGYPGPEGAMLDLVSGLDKYGDGLDRIPTEPQPDWALGEHLNGVHSLHVTNLHTHGLHVAPGRNDNGTYSDDIFLRIVPTEDAIKIAQNPGLYAAYQENRDEIISSSADFEFRLGNVMEGIVGPNGTPLRGLPHPPGTHWYHPHSHGATQNQVASGMAGFLIVEGDVDDLIAQRLAGTDQAAHDRKTGDWDYRERAMFFQRVFIAQTANISGAGAGPDTDAPKGGTGSGPLPLVNGAAEPDTIVMRPGAIERWRVLNGSVDGGGGMRFAVLKGRFEVDAKDAIQRVRYRSGSPVLQPVTTNDYTPLSVQTDDGDEPVEKADIWQLAWDGVTRVVPDGSGGYRYEPRDLSTVNGGVEPDLDGFAQVYDPANLALCYNRPNELMMGDGNRTDILFQAPELDGDSEQVYTIVSLPTRLDGTPEGKTTILGHVVVRGDVVPGGSGYDFSGLLSGLTVHPYELPVSDDDIAITTPAERAARGVTGDGTTYRTRTVRYAGLGSASWPLIDAGPDYIAANPDLARLTYYEPPPADATEYTLPVPNGSEAAAVTGISRFPSGDLPAIVLPANTRSMNIDGEKFFPTSEQSPKMLVDTAEEWAVYNQSIDTYSVSQPDPSWSTDQLAAYLESNAELVYYAFEYVDDPPQGALTSPQPYFGTHRYTYPMTLAQVQRVNAARSSQSGDPWTQKGMITQAGRAVDHPFHIHQNPFWLMRIDVPDQDGNLVNILPEPRWADVVTVPRNGGRIVMRSRFVDFEGEFVNHCHILLHEDNGMMQRVQVVGDPADSDYEPSTAAASADATPDDVDAVYAPPSLADSWARSIVFEDRSNTGQSFPGAGFVVEPPVPPTE